jgi:hypothetical protein
MGMGMVLLYLAHILPIAILTSENAVALKMLFFLPGGQMLVWDELTTSLSKLTACPQNFDPPRLKRKAQDFSIC